MVVSQTERRVEVFRKSGCAADHLAFEDFLIMDDFSGHHRQAPNPRYSTSSILRTATGNSSSVEFYF